VIKYFSQGFLFAKVFVSALSPHLSPVGCSQSTVHLSLLAPSYSPSLQFHEIDRHGQKKLMKSQEIVKEVYHDKTLTRMYI
jgi:hypothetical protein